MTRGMRAYSEVAGERHELKLGDPSYPSCVAELKGAPGTLYVVGDPTALSTPSLSIVGARCATRHRVRSGSGPCRARGGRRACRRPGHRGGRLLPGLGGGHARARCGFRGSRGLARAMGDAAQAVGVPQAQPGDRGALRGSPRHGGDRPLGHVLDGGGRLRARPGGACRPGLHLLPGVQRPQLAHQLRRLADRRRGVPRGGHLEDLPDAQAQAPARGGPPVRQRARGQGDAHDRLRPHAARGDRRCAIAHAGGVPHALERARAHGRGDAPQGRAARTLGKLASRAHRLG